ncbi:DNA alkylation repair protein [Candidatus Saccharibacteria bacterium]|nr:DNA alkylation repair protein [Candidatus Saccharibacteria bacterium]
MVTESEWKLALAQNADDYYRDFIMRGIPSERPFIGVRIPKIREIAKSIPYEEITVLLDATPVAFEEVLFRGMLVARLPYQSVLKYFDSQVNIIDDWCSCDTFCSEIRPIIKKQRDDFLNRKVEKLLQSEKEFPTRIGLVILKNNYMDFDYLFTIFDRVENLKDREEYYVKMAIAWLIAECFTKFPEETLGFLKSTKLPKWTFNKTISKICDSYRVDDEMKELLRRMRK